MSQQPTKAGYKQTEVGLIPEDWEVKSLGELFDITAGRDLEKEHFSPIEDDTFRYPIYANALTKKGLYGYSKIGRYSGDKITVTARGDIGKAVYRKKDFNAIGRLLVLASKINLEARFITEYINNFVEFASESTGVPQLTSPQIAKYYVPLPPTKAEQKAIAEALSDADALIESLERLIAKKRDIKHGAMQELLRPRNGWQEIQLGDVASFFKGKGLPKSEIQSNGNTKCIHYGELFTFYSEIIKEVESRTEGRGDYVLSQRNDVLMPTSDVTPNGLAKASCINEDGVILGGDILVIRSHRNTLDGSFLSYQIRSQKEQILQLVTGTTVYHLYAADMKKFMFFAPSLEEQTAIVRILSEMRTELSALEAQLNKARELKRGMMQVLLTGAVRLVPTPKFA